MQQNVQSDVLSTLSIQLNFQSIRRNFNSVKVNYSYIDLIRVPSCCRTRELFQNRVSTFIKYSAGFIPLLLLHQSIISDYFGLRFRYLFLQTTCQYRFIGVIYKVLQINIQTSTEKVSQKPQIEHSNSKIQRNVLQKHENTRNEFVDQCDARQKKSNVNSASISIGIQSNAKQNTKNDFLRALDAVSLQKSSYDSSLQNESKSLEFIDGKVNKITVPTAFNDILNYFNANQTTINQQFSISEIQIRSIIEQFFFFCQNISTQLQAAVMAKEIGQESYITIKGVPRLTLGQFNERFNNTKLVFLLFIQLHQQMLVKSVNNSDIIGNHQIVINQKISFMNAQNMNQDKESFTCMFQQIILYFLSRIAELYNHSKDLIIYYFIILYMENKLEIMLVFSEFYTIISSQQYTQSGTQPDQTKYKVDYSNEKLIQAVSRGCGIIFDQQVTEMYEALKGIPSNKLLFTCVAYLCQNKDKFNMKKQEKEQQLKIQHTVQQLKDFSQQISYFLPLLVAQISKNEQKQIINQIRNKLPQILSLKGDIGNEFEQICQDPSVSTKQVYNFCQKIVLQCCKELVGENV